MCDENIEKIQFLIEIKYLPDIYLFQVNSGNTGVMCEIYSKLTITIPMGLCSRSLLSLNRFHIVLVLPLLTLNR